MSAEAGAIDERASSADAFLSLVRAVRAGDAAAFEELMKLTERRVAQLAWSILGDTEETKDAVQETFLRVYRHLRRYDENRSFPAWLSRVTVNVCRDSLRRRRGQRIFEPLSEDTHSSAEPRADDELIRRGEATLLGRAIDRLAPKERMAVILRDLEGMATDEVAEALGSSVSTVRVQISRARVKLRGFIEAMRGSPLS